jgi:stress-induced morphogen
MEQNAMAMVGTEIERLIKQAFPDAEVSIVDLRGDGDHFGARVVSSAFLGKSRIQQHKMVYAALQGQMGGALHALAMETAVPQRVDQVLHRVEPSESDSEG